MGRTNEPAASDVHPQHVGPHDDAPLSHPHGGSRYHTPLNEQDFAALDQNYAYSTPKAEPQPVSNTIGKRRHSGILTVCAGQWRIRRGFQHCSWRFSSNRVASRVAGKFSEPTSVSQADDTPRFGPLTLQRRLPPQVGTPPTALLLEAVETYGKPRHTRQ